MPNAIVRDRDYRTSTDPGEILGEKLSEFE